MAKKVTTKKCSCGRCDQCMGKMAMKRIAKKSSSKSMKLGGGGRFAKLSNTVSKEYIKKGMSPAKARAIGNAVSAKQGIAKYGQKKMTRMAVAGKKRNA